jgi:uncharacterized pyridoxal phosphate-containing UPF0001 family protein
VREQTALSSDWAFAIEQGGARGGAVRRRWIRWIRCAGGAIERCGGQSGKRLPVLIEVKLSPEATKTELSRSRTKPRSCWSGCPTFGSEVRGLMTIAPWGAAEDVTRACFRSLREWRDRWAAAHPNCKLDVLSMGMSGDFALAIQEGATRIRIGTALFGKRASRRRTEASQEPELD